jgi:hypothetical protein
MANFDDEVWRAAWDIRSYFLGSSGCMWDHATEGDLYGNWMIEELAQHGYKIGPGTLCAMLHGMERKAYLESRKERAGR